MKNMFSLSGKTIVVTGGTGVLGESFNKAIQDAGANVVIIGRNKEKAEQRAHEIIQNGGNAIGLSVDVTKIEVLEFAKKTILDKYGAIDGLVNGAGGNMPGAVVQPGGDIFDLDIQSLKEVMDLNLFGTILPTQVFAKEMLNSNKGSIVNISSVSAHKALTRVLGYSLAKTAIESYTKWFAIESAKRYGDKLRFNTIVPGFFLTEQNRTLLTNEDGTLTSRGQDINKQTPFSRFGQPEELTGALVWLLSDASAFVNGSSIIIDGGFLSYSGV
ncbi:MAG: D-mannonate oxidoreductase [Pseudopedobacter saltans]|uniref:D-mannonate oxidoreductase n=1 Tax=Pseudopedobacter saltans TaxID=151895 RepID=A0A2W5EEZ0_9SPHI|nr:MAG: D-mannonate oxidoreductase [Pseudopedobacter saltans]